MEPENEREKEVLENLEVDKFMNPEALDPKKVKEKYNNEEEDIFEIAKQRGEDVG